MGGIANGKGDKYVQLNMAFGVKHICKRNELQESEPNEGATKNYLRYYITTGKSIIAVIDLHP